LGYFVWYPRIRAQIGFDTPLREARILPNEAMRIELKTIKTSGELLADSFVVRRRLS
jgi:hypothetical protein